MESPHSRHPLLLAAITLLLLGHGITVAAADWQLMTPPAATIGGNGVTARQQAVYQQAPSVAGFGTRIGVPTEGFLNRAFTPRQHSGKLGSVVDALGLGHIYNNPTLRDLLGRFHGSRFCMTDGCGINLKLSLRKPGLRFEHRF